MVPHATDPIPDSGVDLAQHDGETYGDWRDEFHRDGFGIVKVVITPERAEHYRRKQIERLQSFGLGFDPNDESIWTQEHLPVSFQGGMYFAHASTDEKFGWWFEDHGCEMIETNLDPSDLALWDSRTMHYAKFAKGERIRHVQYIFA